MADLSEIKSLQERIARIEEAVKEIQKEIGAEQKGSGWWGGSGEEGSDPGDGALTDEEAELVHKGNDIEAVKLYHERTGSGLAAAKEAVDRFTEQAGPS